MSRSTTSAPHNAQRTHAHTAQTRNAHGTWQVKQAMSKNVPMVTEEFLWDSIKAGKLLDYKKYEIKSDD